MKRRYVAITLGLVLAMAPLSGCTDTSSEDTTVSSDKENTEDTIYGEVKEVRDSSITIEVGTRKEMEKPDESSDMKTQEETTAGSEEQKDTAEESGEQKDTAEGSGTKEDTTEESGTQEDTTGGSEAKEDTTEGSEDQDDMTEGSEAQDDTDSAGENPPKEQPSMLELTGEEQQILLTDDTVIQRQNMGGGLGNKPPEDTPGDTSEDTQEEVSKTQEDSEKEETSGDGESAQEAADAEEDVDAEAEKGDKAPEQQETEEISVSDIKEGDIVAVTLDEEGNAAEITVMSMGGAMEQQGGVDSYDAAVEYTTDTETQGESYTSTGTDENAVHVYQGAEVTIKDASVHRTSSESKGGDASSFYGVGAALLTTDGISYISDSTIETDAKGGAGIFAYGDGTVYVSDTEISTSQDTSGGIHAAGGGRLYAWNLTVNTKGESSAAIRSDRGGGTMVIDGGTYTSEGTGSPAVYSTADISVNGAQLTANGSEAVCIEGLNSLRLFDCDLTGNMSDDEQNDCTWNVILYQSMSGDSEVGNSTFEMNGGTLTAGNGGMFYTTNTESTITLSDVDISYAQDNEFFLRCTGNDNERGWGVSGENGGDCLFTAISQEMKGDIIWDNISTLDFYMTEGSRLEGAVVQDNTYGAEEGDGYCKLYLSEDSTWVVTGDSRITALYNAGTLIDDQGNSVTVKGSDGTVYQTGTGDYTVTVDSYEENADTSNASEASQWEDYQVEKAY